MPVERLRGDEPLVRHLGETFATALAARWQGLHYLRMPGDGFADYLVGHEQDLVDTMPTVELLPFDDCLLDFAASRRLFLTRTFKDLPASFPDRGQSWARVTDGATYLRRAAAYSPWLTGLAHLLAFIAADPGQWVAIEVWEASVGRPDGSLGFPAYPDVTLVRRADPWTMTAWAHLYPNPQCRADRAFGAGFCNLARCQYPEGHPVMLACVGSELVMSTGATLALRALAYLTAADEYLVRVQPQHTATPATPIRPPMPARGARAPQTPQSKQQQHKAQILEQRPWLRRDLPHYILIDPARLADYRPSPAQSVSGRASPTPHARRGHWRTLRSERFKEHKRVKVKPTWVGDNIWKFEGQRYQVVLPPPVHDQIPSASPPPHPPQEPSSED